MPRKLLLIGLGVVLAAPLVAQDAIPLAEKFDVAEPYRVELKVRLSGRLAVPTEKGKAPQVLPISGSSTLIYDERPLAPDADAKTAKAIRSYREVEFARTVDGKDQKAEIRPAVRRMIVMRSDRGKKAPFSPDGPLTWGEIDVVRTDIFAPALVPGLLPTKPVKPGDKWTASAVAVAELTDFDPIEEGNLTVEFVTTVILNNKHYAKLSILGTVKGQTDDGPSRQKLDGLAYFELGTKRLEYLNLKGTHELLGSDGKTTGKIDGTFVMTRGPAGRILDLTDLALRGLDLKPSATNTELLYDNPDLGLKFHYPRRWRVGTAQGKQLTLEESSGGTIILTVEPSATLPTADQYLKESQEFLKKQNWAVTAVDSPRRVTDRPNRLDRFSLDADVKGERIRMEYAVASQAGGGATVAARLPWREREALERDVDRILRTLTITKRIDK